MNKLHILAAVPEIKELYQNLEIILGELDLVSLDWTGSSDIKMVLLVIGKEQASFTYACPYCECKSPWLCTCKLNTLGSLCAWYDKWVEAGADLKKRKMWAMWPAFP